MKKYYYITMVLSLAGLVISAFLVADHYIPELTVSMLKCGDGLYSSCSQVSNSEYSKIFGIPFSVLGFFFYLWIILTAFIFRESSPNFWKQFAYILLPVAIAGILADFYFAGILIYLQLVCYYCIATYVANILLLLTAILFYKKVNHDNPENYFARIKRYFSDVEISEYAKFSSGSYLFFTAFLFLFMVSFTLYMNQVTSLRDNNPAFSDTYLRTYLEQEKVDNDFQGGFTVGNPDASLEIVVVTDPLCSACFSFYGSEKKLLQIFDGKIKFTYYFYPLDKNCNKDMENTVYSNSCKAVQSIITASNYIPFEEVMDNFYDSYNDLHEMFRKGFYDKLVFDSLGVDSKTDLENFMVMYKSEKVIEKKKQIIKTTIENKIEATPTFFINGRKIEGAPPTLIFEKIIEYELSKINE